MRAKEIKAGQRFNRWTVLSEGQRRAAHRTFRCKCSCGTVKRINLNALLQGTSKSCGCLLKEVVTKHGHAKNGKVSSVYKIWTLMRRRCRDKNDGSYHNYGGRGIRVCERWNSFETFLADVGPRPSRAHSLDRYPNNNGNYEPGNVRWATNEQQRANTRATIWERVVMLLAGEAAGIVAKMVAEHKQDHEIAQHIARVFKPQEITLCKA